MKYAIRTIDDECWLGVGGDYITEIMEERWILDEEEMAQWHVDNTNIFGDMKVVYVR